MYLLCAGLLATAAFFLRVWRRPAFQQILFLTCGAILLPPASYDYTLLHLFIPLACFAVICVERARTGADLQPLLLPALLIGIALSPLPYLSTRTSTIRSPLPCALR